MIDCCGSFVVVFCFVFVFITYWADQSRKYFPYSFGDVFIKHEMNLCALFGLQLFSPWNDHSWHFVQFLSYYCWIMKAELKWGKWSQQSFRCCSGFDIVADVVLEQFCLAVSGFLHLWTVALTVACWSLKSLRNISVERVTKPDFSNFVSHLLLSFFRS